MIPGDIAWITRDRFPAAVLIAIVRKGMPVFSICGHLSSFVSEITGEDYASIAITTLPVTPPPSK